MVMCRGIQGSRDIQTSSLFVCTKAVSSMLRSWWNPAIWQWCGLRSHWRSRCGLRQNELMHCRAHGLATLTSTAVSPPWGEGRRGTSVWLGKLSAAQLTTTYGDDLHFSLGTSLNSHVDKWVLLKWTLVLQSVLGSELSRELVTGILMYMNYIHIYIYIMKVNLVGA